jgi:hypothetical protein
MRLMRLKRLKRLMRPTKENMMNRTRVPDVSRTRLTARPASHLMGGLS